MRISHPGKNKGSVMADALSALFICVLIAAALFPGLELISRRSAALLDSAQDNLSRNNSLIREGLDELSP